MGERRENSVLTSLRDLRRIEDERVKQEEQEEQKRQDAAQQAREAAEARVREAAEAKAREEADARARAEAERQRQDREERIRIEETERKARIEAQMKLEQERLRLEAMHGKKGFPWHIVGPIIGVFVLGLVVFGFVAYRNKEEARKRDFLLAQQEQRLAQEKAANEALAAQQAQSQRHINELMDQLKSAKTDAERAALEKSLEDERSRAAQRVAGPRTSTPKTEPAKTATPEWRQKGGIKLDNLDDPTGGIKEK